jgi:hypothetical protein
MKDATRAVNGHNFRVEKGKNLSYMTPLSLQFSLNCGSFRTQGKMMDFAGWLVG